MLSKINKIMKLSFSDKIDVLSYFYYGLKTKLIYRPLFKSVGKKTKIIKPLRISNPKYISLGSNVIVNKFTWLFTDKTQENIPDLFIDDGAALGHFNHITCVNRVYIGKKVLTADRVFIADNTHEYKNIYKPIMDQEVTSAGSVSIGEGTWIGENACILGCNIGKNCVIGANSVVTLDIPDYCVAVGSPAKIIKKYNFDSNEWEKIM